MNEQEFPNDYFGAVADDSLSQSKEAVIKSLSLYKRKHLVGYINSLPQGAIVLDSGCGKGKTVRLIHLLRPDVVVKGHDITDLSHHLPDGFEFVKCSTEEIKDNYEKESFDSVISQHVFEHMVYPTATMENFISVLKPGGTMFIETPNWTRLFIPFSRLYFWNDYTHIHPFCKRAFERMFTEYRLEPVKIVSVSSVDYPQIFRRVMKAIGFGAKRSVDKNQEQTGHKAYRIKKSVLRKIWENLVDVTFHPFAKDILIGIAQKSDNK